MSWPSAYECAPGEYYEWLDSQDLSYFPEEAIPIWTGAQSVPESIYCRWTLGMPTFANYTRKYPNVYLKYYRNLSWKCLWGAYMAGGKSGGWAFTRTGGTFSHSSKRLSPPRIRPMTVSGATQSNSTLKFQMYTCMYITCSVHVHVHVHRHVM